uniref:Transmembrane protein n=1 Tax=Arabidopsis thaliana TaxID=3702 RepID=Q8GW41_ARATH|nr:unknown protein [Arabidopsis thaliana]
MKASSNTQHQQLSLCHWLCVCYCCCYDVLFWVILMCLSLTCLLTPAFLKLFCCLVVNQFSVAVYIYIYESFS